jgi:hypothetical protein
MDFAARVSESIVATRHADALWSSEQRVVASRWISLDVLVLGRVARSLASTGDRRQESLGVDEQCRKELPQHPTTYPNMVSKLPLLFLGVSLKEGPRYL